MRDSKVVVRKVMRLSTRIAEMSHCQGGGTW